MAHSSPTPSFVPFFFLPQAAENYFNKVIAVGRRRRGLPSVDSFIPAATFSGLAEALTEALANLQSANATVFSADGFSITGGYDSDKQEACALRTLLSGFLLLMRP